MSEETKTLKTRMLARYADHLDAILWEVGADKTLGLGEIEAMALKIRKWWVKK